MSGDELRYMEPPVPHTDLVSEPAHYLLLPEEGVQVKHITKALLDRVDRGSMEISSISLSWLVQAIQYQLRFDKKGGKEDIEKSIECLQLALENW